MSTPAPRAPLPAEFRLPSSTFGRFLAPFLGVLVLFFAVMLLLGAILTTSTPGGIAVGALATAVLVGVLHRKFRALVAHTVVRFSEAGVELVDGRGFRTRLAWADVTRIDTVHSQLADGRPIGHGFGARARVGRSSSEGLVGWGERVTPARIPGWMRDQLAAAPVNPANGRPEVAIPVGALDPSWTLGPMGDWVRRFRPDLLPPVPPVGQAG